MTRFLLYLTLAAFSLLPIKAQTVVRVDAPGGLSQAIMVEHADTCSNLVVYGALNSSDVHLLRHLCGYEADCHQGLVGHVRHLDLRNASFVKDKLPYMELSCVKECVYGWAMPGYYSGNQDLIVIQHPGLNGSSTKTWGGAPFYKPSILIAGRNDLHFQSSYGVKGLQGELVDLSKPVDKKGWRKARNRWMTKLKGHQLVRGESGECFLRANLLKGKTSYDMFYKCSTLQTVFFPKGTVFLGGIYVYEPTVKYYIGK